MQFHFGVEGIPQTLRRLMDTNRHLDNEITRTQREWAGGVVLGNLYGTRNYVASPPGSRYRRTGTLGRGWGWTAIDRYQVSIYNRVAYSSYVVGNDIGRQAWMHRGRWWQAITRITTLMTRLHSDLERGMGRVISNL